MQVSIKIIKVCNILGREIASISCSLCDKFYDITSEEFFPQVLFFHHTKIHASDDL